MCQIREEGMNVLVLTAHHDDLELGCGGTIAKLHDGGNQIISLVLTNSEYRGPDKTIIRTKDAAKEGGALASQVLGYKLISFDEHSLDIPITDRNIVKILRVVDKYRIDTVFTHWHGDTHPPHKRVHAMALHACRHIPRVLGFAVNWYIGEQVFSPNFFVSISQSHWEQKIQALKCYQSEFIRAGGKWVEYLNNQTLNWGIQVGVKRAEGFVIYKYLWSM
jgi:LmbE family N-acetylglucosaminyl deacetylase